MPEVAVAITVHKRLAYFARVMNTWMRAGILEYPYILQVEPVEPAVIDLAYRYPHAKVNVNPEVYGALGNPWHALKAGFDSGADFVILGEDDSVVAPDVFAYFAYCERRYRNEDVMGVCTFTRHPLAAPYETVLERRFASVVWGTWRDRWESYIRETWGFNYHEREWDWRLHHSGHYFAFPGHSRSQHIGRYGGTHMREGDYDELKSKCFYQGAAEGW